MYFYATLMLIVGLAIPVLATLNAGLGLHLGAPMAASVILFSVALCTAIIAALITGIGPIAKAATAPKHLFLAGVLIAFYVLSITAIAPKFGVGNAIFFILLGQLISAAVIDHFGLFGAKVTEINWTRFSGLALMALGVMLTQKA